MNQSGHTRPDAALAQLQAVLRVLPVYYSLLRENREACTAQTARYVPVLIAVPIMLDSLYGTGIKSAP